VVDKIILRVILSHFIRLCRDNFKLLSAFTQSGVSFATPLGTSKYLSSILDLFQLEDQSAVYKTLSRSVSLILQSTLIINDFNKTYSLNGEEIRITKSRNKLFIENPKCDINLFHLLHVRQNSIGYSWFDYESSRQIMESMSCVTLWSRRKVSKGYCIRKVQVVRQILSRWFVSAIQAQRRSCRALHLLFCSKSHLYRATLDASAVFISPEYASLCDGFDA